MKCFRKKDCLEKVTEHFNVTFSTATALQLQKWLLAPPGDLAATDL